MFFLYNIFSRLFYIFIFFGSFFSSKISDFRTGRSDLWSIIRSKDLSNCIWFHVSSLGEFEQIRHIIETLKRDYPSEKILITFFSPSGYNYQKNYSFADTVCYLPFDFEKDVALFINIVKPKIAVWVRYEFWINVLKELKNQSVPIVLVNGVFRDPMSRFYVPYLKQCLSLFTSICVINESSKTKLKKLGYESQVVADSRIDRVMKVKNDPFSHPVLDHFCNTKKSILIAGSTWFKDEDLFKTLDFNSYKLIIVPHNVNKKRIDEINIRFPNNQRLSIYDPKISSDILVVDTMGLLSKIYRYGSACYVGGGFNKVVHSVLEPLVYLKPIYFGPNYYKNEEAKDLINEEVAFSISKIEDFYLSYNKNSFSSSKAINYISSKINATQKVIDILMN